MNITSAQLTRLQTLYAQYSRRAIDLDSSRECRLKWAAEILRQPVTSFSKLSFDDAGRLIDALHGALGIETTPRRRKRAKMQDRDLAQAAGTEGRHDGDPQRTTMASQRDLDRIQDAIKRLDWSQDQFEQWLRSQRSPLARKVTVAIAPTSPTIRTTGEANRVWWALKKMLKQRGLWKDLAPAAGARERVPDHSAPSNPEGSQ
jgi:hypothetical protein